MSRQRKGGWSWGPVEGAAIRVLSLGAGIQSTTLALMAAHGEIGPMPDVAIFADTGDEPAAVMDHLRFLRGDNVLPFPIDVVTAGRRLSDDLAGGVKAGPGRFAPIPFFTSGGGMGRRQCTREFKIEPINKRIRALLGYRPRQRIPVGAAEVWIGISTDEVVRAGASFDRWTVNRYPLLEQRMSRSDCEIWLERHGYPVPPKSACVFCPYRTNAQWRDLRERDPEAFEEACRIDDLIRTSERWDEKLFIHKTLMPLRSADIRSDEERGQGFLFECEGGCGL